MAQQALDLPASYYLELLPGYTEYEKNNYSIVFRIKNFKTISGGPYAFVKLMYRKKDNLNTNNQKFIKISTINSAPALSDSVKTTDNYYSCVVLTTNQSSNSNHLNWNGYPHNYNDDYPSVVQQYSTIKIPNLQYGVKYLLNIGFCQGQGENNNNLYTPTTGYCTTPIEFCEKNPNSKSNNLILENPTLDRVQPAIIKTESYLKIPFYINSNYEEYQMDLRFVSSSSGTSFLAGQKDYITLKTTYHNKTLVLNSSQLFNSSFEPGIYKIQIRQKNKSQTSEWSNTSLIKILEFKPDSSLNEISAIGTCYLNCDKDYKFTGSFEVEISEKVDKYRFILYRDSEIVQDSDWQFHISYNDIIENGFRKSFDSFIFDKLIYNSAYNYEVEYKILTFNNYEHSQVYKFKVYKPEVAETLPVTLSAIPTPERGAIRLTITPNSGASFEEGKYVIQRADEKNNFINYIDLKTFTADKLESSFSYLDFIIESGVQYKYRVIRIDQYEKIAQEVVLDQAIECIFEYSFIYADGKQLALKYNNNMNSFKKTKLENKQDTIGSQYPYIVRNGSVYYAEFPINGLISIYSDNMNDFLTLGSDGAYYYENNLVIPSRKNNVDTIRTSTDAVITNQKQLDYTYTEKAFRECVEKFLNNNNSKLFKSPTEGNIIIQITGVSFSPNQSLNRDIAELSATAYEIAQYNYNNLKSEKIISTDIDLPIGDYFKDKEYIYIKRFNSDFSINSFYSFFATTNIEGGYDYGRYISEITYFYVNNLGNTNIKIYFDNSNNNYIICYPMSSVCLSEDYLNKVTKIYGNDFQVTIVALTKIYTKRKLLSRNRMQVICNVPPTPLSRVKYSWTDEDFLTDIGITSQLAQFRGEGILDWDYNKNVGDSQLDRYIVVGIRSILQGPVTFYEGIESIGTFQYLEAKDDDLIKNDFSVGDNGALIMFDVDYDIMEGMILE